MSIFIALTDGDKKLIVRKSEITAVVEKEGYCEVVCGIVTHDVDETLTWIKSEMGA